MRAYSCRGFANRLSTMLGAMRRISDGLNSYGDDDDFIHTNGGGGDDEDGGVGDSSGDDADKNSNG